MRILSDNHKSDRLDSLHGKAPFVDYDRLAKFGNITYYIPLKPVTEQAPVTAAMVSSQGFSDVEKKKLSSLKKIISVCGTESYCGCQYLYVDKLPSDMKFLTTNAIKFGITSNMSLPGRDMIIAANKAISSFKRAQTLQDTYIPEESFTVFEEGANIYYVLRPFFMTNISFRVGQQYFTLKDNSMVEISSPPEKSTFTELLPLDIIGFTHGCNESTKKPIYLHSGWCQI